MYMCLQVIEVVSSRRIAIAYKDKDTKKVHSIKGEYNKKHNSMYVIN
jgi:hypothetical protein